MTAVKQDLQVRIDESIKNMKKFDRFLDNDYAQTYKDLAFMKK